jgi:GR25 family glycosyltransferase involved in LPS biosynthesis
MEINIISEKDKLILLKSISNSIQINEFITKVHPPCFISNNDQNDFDQTLSTLFYGRKLHNGELGCSLAHSRLISNLSFISSDWNLILEDDAKLDNDIFNFLYDLKAIKISQPTVILLGHSRTLKKNIFWQRLKHPLSNEMKIGKYTFGQNKWVNGCGVGTVGYVINSSCRDIINKLPKNFWLADDWKFFHNAGISIYHPINPLVWEDFLAKESRTGNSIKIHHNFISSNILREFAEIIYARLRLLFYNDFN